MDKQQLRQRAPYQMIGSILKASSYLTFTFASFKLKLRLRAPSYTFVNWYIVQAPNDLHLKNYVGANDNNSPSWIKSVTQIELRPSANRENGRSVQLSLVQRHAALHNWR